MEIEIEIEVIDSTTREWEWFINDNCIFFKSTLSTKYVNQVYKSSIVFIK